MRRRSRPPWGGGEGAPAPLLSGRTIDGAPYDLREYAGHVVLVNFWATWCPPCRVEMPGFQRVYEDRRDDGFVVLGLSMDATGVASVREFLDERGITFPVAMAGPGDTVVIAGKGHETYQIFRDRTVPFDDRLVAAEALRARAGSGL
ncbi:MAG: TlpA disulfide reductase family protein [Thermaerobacter sp.]